jgi:hypothetical protein
MKCKKKSTLILTILVCHFWSTAPCFHPFLLLIALDVFGGSEFELPPKKLKNNNDAFHKCKKIWATSFLWAKMLKSDYGEVNYVKYIFCLAVKGKDVILGPKINTLDKHVGKRKKMWRCHTLVKRKVSFM